MVAPNGARRTKADHPNLPMTPVELAETASACADAGAIAIHLHARDGRGQHTLARHIYESYLLAVERAVGERMQIQLTTEAAGRYDRHQQVRAVQALQPKAVSLALRELVPDDVDIASASLFFGELARRRADVQIILYEAEELERLYRLHDAGVIPISLRSVLFVLGRYLGPGEAVRPEALMPFLERRRNDTEWMVCAFGKEETACLALAASLGGHLRVGFENSLWLGNGRLAGSNAEKVAEICEIVDRIGRPRATSAELLARA